MNVLEMARLHRSWLGQNQALIAANIANVNTPGYRARRAHEFHEALREALPPLNATDTNHIQWSQQYGIELVVEESSTLSLHSGNSVDVEAELLSAGDVKAAYAMNVSVTKAFGRMLSIVAKA